MKIGSDGMITKTKCAITKSKLKKVAEANVDLCDCSIHASVTAGTFIIDIPKKNLKVTVRTEDLLSVLNATNQKYMELRQAELNTPLVKE